MIEIDLSSSDSDSDDGAIVEYQDSLTSFNDSTSNLAVDDFLELESCEEVLEVIETSIKGIRKNKGSKNFIKKLQKLLIYLDNIMSVESKTR